MYNRTSKQPFSIGNSTANFPGETHAGFTRGFEALWPHVRSALQANAAVGGKMSSVTFTGHSQGGAVAALLAYAVGAELGTDAVFTCPSSSK
jgi:acetyl esterase/lipase